MPAAPAPAERTPRRARRRRITNASLAGLVVVALVVGGVVGLRALAPAHRVTPAHSPTPAATGAPEALPTPVAATHDAILAAARARDVSALEKLIDPNRFTYNFGGGNPIVEWRRDPAALGTLAKILEVPFAVNHVPSGGDIYEWPYFTQKDLMTLTSAEREQLATIGVREKAIQDMIRYLGGYTGPRTGIAADGAWVFFVTGGD